MSVSPSEIESLDEFPSAGATTHLRDHGVIARALKSMYPLVATHDNIIGTLAPINDTTFTGTTAVESLKISTSGAAEGKVLAADDADGRVRWVDPLISSVAGRTGAVTLTVEDVSGAAPADSPRFSGAVTVDDLIVRGAEGEAQTGRVLTATDDSGGSAWADIVESGESLPTAGTAYAGRLFRRSPSSGAESLHACLRGSGGTYSWVQIAEG